MMEANLTKLGGSLPVPCVQELPKEAISEVPPRYVRTDRDHPLMYDDHGSLLFQVPVIDLNKLSSSDDNSMESELEKLHFACRDWGFLQLINHGVSCSLVEEVKLGIQEFFELPMEEKRKFWQQEGDVEGFGQAFVVSKEQKLDWGDRFYVVSLPRHLSKPHLFPMLPSPFSIEYRATVNSMKERLSVATFYSPKLEGKMGPAPSLITPDKTALFRRIGVADYLRGYYSRELRGKSYLDVMRTIQDEENKGS